VSAPLIALSGVTLAAAAASATLSINAVALALGSWSCIGLSLLDMCTADRRVGWDARRRSCVGNALDPRCYSRSRKLERHRPLAALSLGILSLDTSSLISLILSLDPRRRLHGEHVCRRLCELAAALGLRSPRIVHSRRSPMWFPFGSWAPRSPARALRSPAHHLGLVTRG
jgi:hypothetical protein